MACDCDKPECNNGYNCHWLEAGNCFFCHCNDLDPNDSDYVEVKAWADSVDAGDARDFVDQGVIGLMCTGEITSNAKKILDNAGIWYVESLEPHELERAIEEGEAES